MTAIKTEYTTHDGLRVWRMGWSGITYCDSPSHSPPDRITDTRSGSTITSVGARPTLAEVNQHASRYLYRLARQIGWRKLTLREQKKHGVEGQWHRCESIGHPTGCGEYTLRSARGSSTYGA